MEYKVAIGKHMKMIAFAVYYIVFILVGSYWFNFSEDTFKVAYVMCILIASSTIYVHINYYLEDRGKTLQVYDDQITITKNGSTLNYLLSNLEAVTITGSKNIENWGLPQYPTEEYFYASLTFTDGKQVYITSLMITDYDKMRAAFQNRYVSRKYGWYNLLPDK